MSERANAGGWKTRGLGGHKKPGERGDEDANWRARIRRLDSGADWGPWRGRGSSSPVSCPPPEAAARLAVRSVNHRTQYARPIMGRRACLQGCSRTEPPCVPAPRRVWAPPFRLVCAHRSRAAQPCHAAPSHPVASHACAGHAPSPVALARPASFRRWSAQWHSGQRFLSTRNASCAVGAAIGRRGAARRRFLLAATRVGTLRLPEHARSPSLSARARPIGCPGDRRPSSTSRRRCLPGFTDTACSRCSRRACPLHAAHMCLSYFFHV
jgi:hypothetical protein